MTLTLPKRTSGPVRSVARGREPAVTTGRSPAAGHMPGSAPGPDNEPHSIVLCDDRRELRSAIRLTLSDAPRFQVVGEASDGVSCLQRVMQFHPDGLIMDFSMPGGCPLPVKAARELHPELHIIVFSGRPDDRTRDAMLDAGANQYVVKIGRLRPLIEALDRAFTPISGRCRN